MTADFMDGPAAGQEMLLSRCPIYLRVVRDAQGRWGALNFLDDEPRDDETIFVYRARWIGDTWHVNYGDRRSGWRTPATYEVVSVLGEQFRWNDKWEAWAERQPVPAGMEAFIPEGGPWPPLSEPAARRVDPTTTRQHTTTQGDAR